MSAAKLEKKIWTLEQRLREEFHAELRSAMATTLAKVDRLETKIRLLEGEKPAHQNEEALVLHVPEGPEKGPERGTATPGAEVVGTRDVVPVVREAWTAELVKQTEPQQEWVPLEPVAFLESTWNLVLVLGFTETGCLDILISCLLLLGSAGLQATFTWILFSKDFLGDDFSLQKNHAEKWRSGVAHDWKHMDLAETSLVSRVCHRDDSLIVSNGQSALIGQINAFLGLKEANPENETGGFPTGILLCMLCIFLWCLYLCNEFRAILLSLEAILQVPRRAYTIFDNGRFMAISYFRFWGYCFARLIRAGIAGALLYAGIRWLANTTSITDLMLNAVALGAVLDVDEMFFTALMPKKVQIKIQDLEAIKISYSKRRSQGEAVFLLLVMVGLLLWPWFYLVQPLSVDMQAVKVKYCGGNHTFVVGMNENAEVLVGRGTKSFSASQGLPVQQAVAAYAFENNDTRIMFEASAQKFERKRTETMGTTATDLLICEDFDAWYLRGVSSEFSELYDTYWWSVFPALEVSYPAEVRALNLDTRSSCAQMTSLCGGSKTASQLLRMVCGPQCGCADPDASPWFRVTAQGCAKKCRDEVQSMQDAQPRCRNIDTNSTIWQQFWDAYPGIIQEFIGIQNNTQAAYLQVIAHQMKSLGCANLVLEPEDPVTQGSFCDGYSSLWAPLKLLCPETCCDPKDDQALLCPSGCYCFDDEEGLSTYQQGYRNTTEIRNVTFSVYNSCSEVVQADACDLSPEDTSLASYCRRSCGKCQRED